MPLCVCDAVTPQNRGRIVFRIEADTEQMSFDVEFWVGSQHGIQLRKIMTHQYAKLRKWAPCIDECQYQHLSPELMEVDFSSTLIQQPEIGHTFAGLRNMIGRCGLTILSFLLGNR